MITFRRQDNLSIVICALQTDISLMTDFFSTLSKNKSASVQIDFDNSIISMKKKSKNKVISLNAKIGEETKFIELQDGGVSWEIEEDDIEYAVFYFREGEINGYFSPAELFQVQINKNKNLDYIYCQCDS